MSLIEVAVDNPNLLDHKTGSLISGGSFSVTTPPSNEHKGEGKKAYSGPLAFTFSGGNATGFVSGSVFGGGIINPTALYSKINNKLVIRKGDFVIMSCTGTVDPPATPPQVAVAGVVEIKDPGQTTWKAE